MELLFRIVIKAFIGVFEYRKDRREGNLRASVIWNNLWKGMLGAVLIVGIAMSAYAGLDRLGYPTAGEVVMFIVLAIGVTALRIWLTPKPPKPE